MWLYISFIHFVYTDKLIDHIDTVNSVCKCEQYIPSVAFVGEKSKEYAEALAKAECLKKCPPAEILQKIKATQKSMAATEEEVGRGGTDEDDEGTIGAEEDDNEDTDF